MSLQTAEFNDWLHPHNSLIVATDPNHELNRVVIHTTDGKPVMLSDTDALKLCQQILFAVRGVKA